MVRMTTGRRKTFRSIKKVATRGKDVIDTVIEATEKGKEFVDNISQMPVKEVMTTAAKLAQSKKSPIGATGLNLLPKEARSVVSSTDAIGDFTSSASMFMYRPPRKSNRVGFTKYQLKTGATRTNSSLSNQVGTSDMNILDAIQVENNPDTDAKYSNLSVKEAFDNYLLAAGLKDTAGTSYDQKIQQTSIHVSSLQSELVITNNNNDTVMVDLYELVPQHTLGPSQYVNENQATGYMSPVWTWTQGLSDTVMVDDALSRSYFQANPFNSSLFSRTWKIVKQVRANISGGSTHRHKSAYMINKTVSYPEMAQFTTRGGKFAGWNPTFMIVQQGVPTSAAQEGVASSITVRMNAQLNYEASAVEQARVIVFDSKT